VSTEPIASAPQRAEAAGSCASCGSSLAEDQRYCLQCGERSAPLSSVLLGGPPSTAVEPRTAQLVPPGYPPPGTRGSSDGDERRGNAVTIIAGVGVLLLAMGVGVLIGRSSAKQSSAPVAPAVISVGSVAPSAPATAGATFTSDWPAGTSAYTVELQTLASSTTQVSAVEVAKSSASAKGAKSVGALNSDEFSSLPAGSYIVYSGTYQKKAEARKALAHLKHNFPAATVIDVRSGGAKPSSAASSSAAGASKSGVGASESHPAPPSVVEDLRKTKGKSYEEKSKNLPDVVSTG
jgi:hypothetical protein